MPYKDRILQHEEKFGRNLDFRRLYNFHARRLRGGEKNAKLEGIADFMQFGCSPMSWENDLRAVEKLYDSLSDEIKNKKVKIDYVDPDPRDIGTENEPDDFAGNYEIVFDKEVSLKEMVDALFYMTKDENGEFEELSLRAGIAVNSKCWWFGKVGETVKALLNDSLEYSSINSYFEQ
jgi:hypothetical protein